MMYLFYNNVSQDHWIGPGGIKEWPPGSTSLNPYDLFWGGWAKFEVYQSKTGVLDKMEENFRTLFRCFNGILKERSECVSSRLQMCAKRWGVC
jgi:hypothetical protein